MNAKSNLYKQQTGKARGIGKSVVAWTEIFKATMPFLVLLYIAIACSPPVHVLNTERADNFHLSQYQTFNFFEVEASGDTIGQRYQESISILKDEIARQLAKKGLRQSASRPDLLVNIGAVVEEKVQTRETNFQTDPPHYIGQRRYTWKVKEVEVGRYREGTVTVDLVDAKRNELVWEGIVEGVVPDKQQKLEKTVAKGMEELFEQLPS